MGEDRAQAKFSDSTSTWRAVGCSVELSGVVTLRCVWGRGGVYLCVCVMGDARGGKRMPPWSKSTFRIVFWSEHSNLLVTSPTMCIVYVAVPEPAPFDGRQKQRSNQAHAVEKRRCLLALSQEQAYAHPTRTIFKAPAQNR